MSECTIFLLNRQIFFFIAHLKVGWYSKEKVVWQPSEAAAASFQGRQEFIRLLGLGKAEPKSRCRRATPFFQKGVLPAHFQVLWRSRSAPFNSDPPLLASLRVGIESAHRVICALPASRREVQWTTVLTPMYEPQFSEGSYGFRPNRSAQGA